MRLKKIFVLFFILVLLVPCAFGIELGSKSFKLWHMVSGSESFSIRFFDNAGSSIMGYNISEDANNAFVDLGYIDIRYKDINKRNKYKITVTWSDLVLSTDSDVKAPYVMLLKNATTGSTIYQTQSGSDGAGSYAFSNMQFTSPDNFSTWQTSDPICEFAIKIIDMEDLDIGSYSGYITVEMVKTN